MIAGRDSRDVRPVLGLDRVERELAVAVLQPRRGKERAAITFALV